MKHGWIRSRTLRTAQHAFCIVLMATAGTSAVFGQEKEWSGHGAYRILVDVPPVDLGGRETDELVASLPINFDVLIEELGLPGAVDLASVQVHQYDSSSGGAIEFESFESSRSAYDRPWRFDDGTLPEPYPARVGRAANTGDGRPELVPRERKGRMFNRLQWVSATAHAGHLDALPKPAETADGRLVWVHTQSGDQASHYAAYFDVTEKKGRYQVSPAPWIGDADVLRKQEGQPLGGLAHFCVSAGDLNGDGLFDLVVGVEKGDIMWFPNLGTPGNPIFEGCRMLRDEEGPIDMGWYGAPFLHDWNADGLVDLLVGTSGNVILWWENVGRHRHVPEFEYRGFVQADGKRLEVPEGPVPEDKADVFKRDYYNQPWVGDWNGDGLPDIVTGGYITGRIFYYKGTGRDEDGVPQLEYVGPLEADGVPIDTTWAAAPYVHDVNNDGLLDLLTGSWWWSGIPSAPKPCQVEFLMYFQNTGSPWNPRLERRPLPKTGEIPSGSIARPAIADWDNDGLADILASAGHSVYAFVNQGTMSSPEWKVHDEELTIPWGFVPHFKLPGKGPQLNEGGKGSPYSPSPAEYGRPTVDGEPIEHPGPGYGDPYHSTHYADWDQDGHTDLLWGTHQGHIYLHRGKPGDNPNPYDFEPGVRLELTTGEPLKVGPEVVEDPAKATDFTIMQGSRVQCLVDDINADGIPDLVLTETFRNIWVFLNTEAGGTDTLEAGVKVGDMIGTGAAGSTMNTVDWNEDGKPDLILAGTTQKPGAVLINQTEGDEPQFDEPIWPLDLPYIFYGPDFMVSDWNDDGDEDILIQSEFYTFWVERSFLDHGYPAASIVKGPESK